MTRPRSVTIKLTLLIGAGLTAATLFTAPIASAQAVACPYGYYYSYGSGCVPASPGYDTYYGDYGYDYGAPVYDSFGLAFGFGGRGGRGGYHGGGGGRGGGFSHGGGGHGGGHR